jgi:signal transduction histidine kinase
MVRRVAELHGGAVTVESELGRGTAVRTTFAWPVEEELDPFDRPATRQRMQAG